MINSLSSKFKTNYELLKETPALYLFFKDVKRSDSLFLPKVNELEDRGIIKNGFQYIPNKLSKLFTGQEHDFTPLIGMNDIIFDRPFRMVTQRLADDGLVPRLYYTIPASIGLSIYTYSKVIDPEYEKELMDNVNEDIEENKERLDFLINNDLRFISIYKKIKEEKKKKGLALQTIIKQSRLEAYWQLTALKQYYTFLISINHELEDESHYIKMKKLKEYNKDKFLNFVLFENTKSVIVQGIESQMRGFFIPDKSVGALSDSVVKLLFKNRHAELLKFEYIAALFDKEGQLLVTSHKSKILEHPFYRKIYEKNISSVDKYFYMQEYAQWEHRFKKWNILGVKKLRKNNKGLYIENSFLSLKDIESEILL